MELSRGPPLKSITAGVSKKRTAIFEPSRATRSNQTDTDFEALDYKNSYNELVVVHQELEKKYTAIQGELQEVKNDLQEAQHRLATIPFAYRDCYTRAATENRDLTKKLEHIQSILRLLVD